MRFNEKNIFLVDGLGAILSALFTGALLPFFADWVGLPSDTLRHLGMIAFIFSIYSLTSFLFVKTIKSFMLAGIILANSVYCLLVVSLLFTSTNLTALGYAYFIAEIFVILGIVSLEVKTYRASFKN